MIMAQGRASGGCGYMAPYPQWSDWGGAYLELYDDSANEIKRAMPMPLPNGNHMPTKPFVQVVPQQLDHTPESQAPYVPKKCSGSLASILKSVAPPVIDAPLKKRAAENRSDTDLAVELVPDSSSEPNAGIDDMMPLLPVGLLEEDAESSNRARRRRNRKRFLLCSAAASTNGDHVDTLGGVELAPPNRTTVMIRHIACRYNQHDIKTFLDDAGLGGKYDFVHLPSNPSNRANLGYVFVNFTSPEYVEECRQKFDGQLFGKSRTQKKCQVVLAHMQGYVRVSGSIPDEKTV